jgi:acyl-CoA reductase-like NAD-dependent aldehyde dehydrogenase
MCLALENDETHWISQIWINQYNVLYNNVPFGGKKQSGIGTRDEPF